MTVPVRSLFDQGDRPTITGTFLAEDDTLTSPTAVTVLVLTPAGTVTTYTSPNAAIVIGSGATEGIVTFRFPSGTLNAPGTWTVRMKGTAGLEVAGELAFDVRRSAFPSP